MTFFLVNMLISAVFFALEAFYLTTWKVEVIYSLLILLPMLSLTVRRLHDTNRSAWWYVLVIKNFI
ncbi:Inner membrane protein YhaH [Marinomonas spartinae]|uniref:Inner membrane protein YhaH n=1 Tax=Marinomonas spartinae TaxID=1792290 RepID=A0A1A8TM51_9GAMM|nr:Inner membrane protein YhaH [Marinomonas spartinae]